MVWVYSDLLEILSAIWTLLVQGVVLTQHNAGRFSFIRPLKIYPLLTSSFIPTPSGIVGNMNVRVVVLKDIELEGLSPILVPEENDRIFGIF